MNIVVYQAVNQVNGKRYVGITKQGLSNRVSKHRNVARNGKGQRLAAAIRKYGESNIVFSPLVVCPTVQYALDTEMALIAAWKPEYNVTLGGDGARGLPVSEETRAKLSKAAKGRVTFLGKKHTPEALEKMRIASTGRKGFWAGKKRPEVMAKLREANLKNPPKYWLGKKRSPETIAKIAAAKTGYKYEMTERRKKSLAENFEARRRSKMKRVVCLNDNKEFESLNAAAAKYGLSKYGVSSVIRGRLKTTGGFCFTLAGVKNA